MCFLHTYTSLLDQSLSLNNPILIIKAVATLFSLFATIPTLSFPSTLFQRGPTSCTLSRGFLFPPFLHTPLVSFSPTCRSTPSCRYALSVAPAFQRACAPHPVRKRPLFDEGGPSGSRSVYRHPSVRAYASGTSDSAVTCARVKTPSV